MRVLHLSTSDTGGAGFAAVRLHHHLLRAGLESCLVGRLVTDDRSDGVVGVRGAAMSAAALTLGRAITRYVYDADRFFTIGSANAYGAVTRTLARRGFVPDVIVAHWTSRFLTPRDLRRLAERFGAPLVLHLLDLEPFTGGCHYPLGCDGFLRQCGRCPAIWPRGRHDLSRRRMRTKMREFGRVWACAVATCEYTYQLAVRSTLLQGRRVEKILYGIDPDQFAPGDPAEARARLGLPQDGRVLFAAAMRPGNRRKGMLHLMEALQRLAAHWRDGRVTVALAGDPQAFRSPSEHRGPVEFVHLGTLDAATSLIDAYQAADLFACPSIEDAGPMMISEAMMCGTPVVSFDMGVARDLVHTGRTGYRAVLADSRDLENGLRAVLSLSPERHQTMRVACRDVGISKLHPDRQVQSFISLFGRMRNEVARTESLR